MIGFGGIVVAGADPAHAEEIVRESIERGVNYFDVAPSYGDAEVKLGPALKPFRSKVFLACKTTRRDRKGAQEELDSSLSRLQTDHLDLYQLHAIKDVDKDVKAALGKGGAMEAILAARKQGIIRHIGFTAHSPQAALAAMREFDFETMMYPINFVCHHHSGFEVDALAEAKKRHMGIIAIKAMAKQKWPKDADRTHYQKCWYEPITDRELARLALSWSLSQGITVAIPPGEEGLYRLALELVSDCKKPTKEQLSHLEQLAETLEPIFRI